MPTLVARLARRLLRSGGMTDAMTGLWTASLVAESADSDNVSEPLNGQTDLDDDVEFLLAGLEVRPNLVAHGPYWWGISFTWQGSGAAFEDEHMSFEYAYALQHALRIFDKVAEKAGLPSWPLAKAELIRGEGRPNIAPTDIDPEQGWYWTAEWQAGERRAAREVASGRVTSFDSDEEFLDAL